VQFGLVVVGVDHRTAPAHLVERVQECDHRLAEAVGQLRGNEDISEILYGRLPSRTDIVVATWNPVNAANIVLDLLTKVVKLRTDDWTAFYRYVDETAVAHLLAVVSASDGEQAAVQIESCWGHSQKCGVAGRVLNQLTLAVKERALRDRFRFADSPETLARQVWGKLQAETCLPAWSKFRHEVDAICAEEIASFRRNCGGLMTDDQERAVKIVTARISERVGEWVTREWSEPGARVPPRLRENS